MDWQRYASSLSLRHNSSPPEKTLDGPLVFDRAVRVALELSLDACCVSEQPLRLVARSL